MPRPVRILTDRVITSSVTGADDPTQNMTTEASSVFETPSTWLGGFTDCNATEVYANLIGEIDLYPEDLSDFVIVQADFFGFIDNQDTNAINLRFAVLPAPLTEDVESTTGGMQSGGNYSPRTGLTYTSAAVSGTAATSFIYNHNTAITPAALTGDERGIWHWQYQMAINLAKVTNFNDSTAQWRQIHSSRLIYGNEVTPSSTAPSAVASHCCSWSRCDFSNGIRLGFTMRKAANVQSRVVFGSGLIQVLPSEARTLGSIL